MSDFMLGKEPLPEKPKCNHTLTRLGKRDAYGDQLYRCTKCHERFNELCAEHHGLIGKGALLKEIIRHESGKS
jgi:transposase-like protein